MEQQSVEPDGGSSNTYRRSLPQAMWKGATGKCPACGNGKMFDGYLKVKDTCSSCEQELHHHQADDAPPYFTILILGHILVPLLIAFERAYTPPLWIHAAIWFPVTLILALFFLRVTKGATVGLQWAFRMHGFGNDSGSVTTERH